LFDMHQRQLRRDRAARQGADMFLLERAFDDCLDRLGAIQRRFAHAALIGCPVADWTERLGALVSEVEPYDPGPLFAKQAAGQVIQEDHWAPPSAAFDLLLSVGTLDSVNDLPLALRLIAHALKPDSLFIGAVIGGHSFPQLRAAMRAADAQTGEARPHVHPRIEAAALAPLLADAGFTMPVVDIDRVQLSYSSIHRLISDLRGMAGTNILTARPRVMTRRAWSAAAATFGELGDGQRTVETVEILHFAAWTARAG
jgi:SAM-dependent methyltransferase